METIKVYSPVEDKGIRNNLNDSPIWKQAYHEDELAEALKSNTNMFEYKIKFEGVKPIQFIGVKKVLK